MKTISLLLIVTIAAMGCATAPRPSLVDPTAPLEPVALSNGIAADAPPPQGMSTGQIIGTIALVALLVPVFVLAIAYSGSRGSYGYGYGHGYTIKTRIYADGTKIKTTVR